MASNPRKWLLVVLPLPFLAGCVTLERIDGARYLFDVALGGVVAAPARNLEYVIFEEERVEAANLEFTTSSYLSKARVSQGEGAAFGYCVPTSIAIILWAGLATTWTGTEYRFTVFSPGFTAATVYPLGIYGSAPDECQGRENIWDSPGLVGGFLHSDVVTNDSVRKPLGCKWEQGYWRTMLPLSEVPATPRDEDSQLFSFQIWTVVQAIKNGQACSSSPECKRILCDAIRQQHVIFDRRIAQDERDAGMYGRHIGSFEDCARQGDSPCATLLKWSKSERFS